MYNYLPFLQMKSLRFREIVWYINFQRSHGSQMIKLELDPSSFNFLWWFILAFLPGNWIGKKEKELKWEIAAELSDHARVLLGDATGIWVRGCWAVQLLLLLLEFLAEVIMAIMTSKHVKLFPRIHFWEILLFFDII